MKTLEIWKDIAGYEGLYQVSTLGRVKSLGNDKTRKERILKAGKCSGYLQVDLYKDGVRKTCRVHQLVARAFIPNPDNLPTVDHINRDRADNRVENLRWADYKIQNENSDNTNRESCKERYSIPVSQYTKDGQLVATYPSGWEAERQTGVWQTSITKCIKGRLKSAGGYVWRNAV